MVPHTFTWYKHLAAASGQRLGVRGWASAANRRPVSDMHAVIASSRAHHQVVAGGEGLQKLHQCGDEHRLRIFVPVDIPVARSTTSEAAGHQACCIEIELGFAAVSVMIEGRTPHVRPDEFLRERQAQRLWDLLVGALRRS